MEILQFASDDSKSVDLKNVPEKPILDFNLKGRTEINYFGKGLESMVSFNNNRGEWELNGRRLTYRNSTSLSGAWWEDIYNVSNAFRDIIMKPNKTYTLTYKIYEVKRYGRDPDFYFRVGYSQYRIGETTPGIYSITFTTNNNVFSDTMSFRGTRGSGENTTQERVFDIEFLSLVEGDKGLKYNTNSLQGIGIDGKGIEVVAQTQAPILGKYILQGDIPGYLNKIEEKVIKNEDTFKINWI